MAKSSDFEKSMPSTLNMHSGLTSRGSLPQAQTYVQLDCQFECQYGFNRCDYLDIRATIQIWKSLHNHRAANKTSSGIAKERTNITAHCPILASTLETNTYS